MKKLLSILACLMFTFSVQAQNDAQELRTMLGGFQELSVPSSIDSKTMRQSVGKYVDNKLAWKFLWEQNEYRKPEATFCQPIGWYKRSESVAVVFHFQGEQGNALAFAVNVQVFNLKNGKLIDSLKMIASFDDKGISTCKLNMLADGTVEVSTLSLSEISAKFQISTKGKIKDLK